ncbi:MAG: helix-turn-helix domain-containing protein [Kineosporiaceae bacterium]
MASISNRVGDLGAYLREQRENAKLSVRQLASLAGVSNPYLSQVERGLRRPSAEVLQQIAKGLRISAEALYVRAGILEEGVRGTLEAAIDADEGLTPRQKKVLRELCAHFRSENARAEEAAEQAAGQAAAGADAAGTGELEDDLDSALKTELTGDHPAESGSGGDTQLDPELDHELDQEVDRQLPATTTTDTAPPTR